MIYFQSYRRKLYDISKSLVTYFCIAKITVDGSLSLNLVYHVLVKNEIGWLDHRRFFIKQVSSLDTHDAELYVPYLGCKLKLSLRNVFLIVIKVKYCDEYRLFT